MEKVTILGATGSIGLSTLDVLARHPDRFEVFALTANVNVGRLAQQCSQFNPRYAVLADAGRAEALRERLASAENIRTEVLVGEEGLSFVAAHDAVDVVMAAIVGAAGLAPTLAAVEAGKKVLLANKEALVMAGGLFMDAVKTHGAILLPIDSEHNAIFQCLPTDYSGGDHRSVSKILLSASGGPFLTTPLAELKSVTPDMACKHPNWSMGRKISVDSATMMNKGLELIEACWLFGVSPDRVEVVIHPQSIIHSMVSYVDGSVLAQLGNPDMRTPIAHALAWPQRMDAGVEPLDIVAVARLDFDRPDLKRFPCLSLAMKAAERGGDAPAILNAANEVAVEAFLAERIGFADIARVVEKVMSASNFNEPRTLDDIQASDLAARNCAQTIISELTG